MSTPTIPTFGRGFFTSAQLASLIGEGALGGKAEGLVCIHRDLSAHFSAKAIPDVKVSIPRMAVVGTDVFDVFMAHGALYDSIMSDDDARIAYAFQEADLPATILGDLRSLVEEVRQPLAIRSSSLLEDALAHPFAGIYETKMVPNNQPDPESRFQRLVEAVKLVYASTFFEGARTYRRVIGADDHTEKMAVLVQEIVGASYGERFYPTVSAVCRSFNYYPTGSARPEDGVVQLALGLGKTIVDGGVAWTYSPRFPDAPPPFASARSMMTETQTRFWAVNMGRPPAYDPVAEAEYLVEAGLTAADYDATLHWIASTYDAAADRLTLGTGRKGPKVLDFGPLLKVRPWPVNDILLELLSVAEKSVGGPAEIEVAMSLPVSSKEVAHIGLVQVRAMATPGREVVVGEADLTGPHVLLASRRIMGNGERNDVRDIVYVKPGAFDGRRSPAIAAEVEGLNRTLQQEGRPYLLIGFGRWGSSDPWLGVPVRWSQVAGARVIVEATLPDLRIDPSQGSHFFHNLSSLGVTYFAMGAAEPTDVQWGWLERQPVVLDTEHLRHVRVKAPLVIRVDGRAGMGFVRWTGSEAHDLAAT